VIGQRVGRFRVVAKLGEGGMGSVWKADDPLLNRVVALKFLPRDLADSPVAYRRFLREARATSALQHSGIATLFEAGVHDGRLFLAVSFVDGETIADRVARGPLPLTEAVRIAADAADALEHAHIRCIVHRDVTSRNIMIARDGRVVVIDFGLALPANTSRITSSDHAVGTVAYLAPETLTGVTADARSDVYSLGIVLYEMVSGALPWPSDRAAAVIYSAMNERPEPPRARRPGTPVALERVILRAMSKDPERRYQSAAHFAQELRAVSLPAAADGAAAPVPAPNHHRRGRRFLASKAKASRPRLPCLVVTPFEHLSSEGDDTERGEAFARGLAEVLAASLARAPGLQVVPPSAVTPIGSGDDPQTLKRKLGATHVLRGSIRRMGDQVRVAFSLIDCKAATQLAGDQVAGSMSDWFAVEDSLLTGVLRAIRVGTSVDLAAMRTLSGVAAHEQYLRALGHLQRTDDPAEVDRAIRLLDELLVAEGDTALVHAALGQACLRNYRVTRAPDWRRRAEASCRTALRLDPHGAEVQITLGRLYVETGQYEEAVTALNASLETRPGNPDAYWLLSRAQQGIGRYRDAIDSAERCVALRPNYWKAHDELGLVYFRRGDYSRSIDQWRRAIELNPEYAMAHSNLGAAHYHLGRLEQAMEAFSSSIAIRPHATAYFGLGTVQFFLGRTPEAVISLEKATELQPLDPRTWGNLGDVLRWVPGENDRSVAALERAISLMEEELRTDPRDARRWSQLAKWLAKRNRVAEALQAIERALELDPQSVEVHARGVTVFHRAGDRSRALEHLGTAARAGYSLVELERDPELEDLRQDAEAQRILADARDTRARKQRETQKEAEHVDH
jgi:eukaryotic-like serine/threonine-protein kinase